MKHYLIAKVAKLGGSILLRKDILANSDQEAMERARQSEDCPVCEVYKGGRKVGAIIDWITGRDALTPDTPTRPLRSRR